MSYEENPRPPELNPEAYKRALHTFGEAVLRGPARKMTLEDFSLIDGHLRPETDDLGFCRDLTVRAGPVKVNVQLLMPNTAVATATKHANAEVGAEEVPVPAAYMVVNQDPLEGDGVLTTFVDMKIDPEADQYIMDEHSPAEDPVRQQSLAGIISFLGLYPDTFGISLGRPRMLDDVDIERLTQGFERIRDSGTNEIAL